MNRALAVAALLFALAAEAGAAPPLKSEVDRILDAPRFAHGWWSMEVRSLRTGKVSYARNAERNVKPASTLKLVTAAAALDAFGPEARLATTVESAGRLDGLGRVLGDVYLVGGADPNLSGRLTDGRITAAFEALADQLAAAGVRRIEGRLVGWEGLFAGERRGDDWAWGDLVWRYGAEVSALSFNDNGAEIIVAPGEREGDPAIVTRQPLTAYYRVASLATTAARGTASTLRLERDFGANTIRLSGAVPLGQPPQDLSVALEDPARYAATVFAEVLATKGILVAGDVVTSSAALPAGRRVLARWESAPMAELVRVVLKVSQNLHTEMLLRLVGLHSRREGSLEAGLEATEEFLRRIGVPFESWQRQDASGLSRSDLVTAHGMVVLLAAMDHHRHAEAFRASLPIAGVDGTLENRMKGTRAEGHVRAKTGTIRNVNALGGYVETRSGERLAFYVAANHHTVPSSEVTGAIDAVVEVLAAR